MREATERLERRETGPPTLQESVHSHETQDQTFPTKKENLKTSARSPWQLANPSVTNRFKRLLMATQRGFCPKMQFLHGSALLRSLVPFALFCGLAFAFFCAPWHSFASFCVRTPLKWLHLGTAENYPSDVVGHRGQFKFRDQPLRQP